jgi:hypothetical protein
MVSGEMRFKGPLPLLLLFLFVCFFAVTAASKGQAEVVDNGDFAIRFEKPLATEHEEVFELLGGSKRISGAVAAMNNSFIMPSGVEIFFRDSGGPSYDPAGRVIAVGYDFVARVLEISSNASLSKQEAKDQTLDVVEYVIYFEMARALADVWEIPLHAAQWESEKQLSIMLVSWMTMEHGIMASVARFQGAYQEGWFRGIGYWDEFALDGARLVQTLQFLYGWDPDTFEDAVSIAGLTAEEISGSAEYYSSLAGRWSEIVTPYVRD